MARSLLEQLPSKRDGREWHFVLLGETIATDWKKNARESKLLDYARLRRTSTARQERRI